MGTRSARRAPDDVATFDRIRAAALTLFAEKGYAATGIRELAERAGLTSGALYHYMGTKEDLLIRIALDADTTLLALDQEAIEGVADPVERIARLVQVHVIVHSVYQLEARVVDTELRSLQGDVRQRVVAGRDAVDALWKQAIADGLASGAIHVDDAEVARLALLQMCTGVCNWYRTDGRLGPYDLARSHVGLALGLLRGRRRNRPVGADDVHLLPPAWFEERRPATLGGDLALGA